MSIWERPIAAATCRSAEYLDHTGCVIVVELVSAIDIQPGVIPSYVNDRFHQTYHNFFDPFDV